MTAKNEEHQRFMNVLKLSELGYWPLLIVENTKRPLEKFKARSPPDRDELLRRLRQRPRLNIAIRLPGLIALDADDEAAKEIIRRYETPFVQSSANGGEHRLFRLQEGVVTTCRQKVNGIGFDIKTGANSYLMLSPSQIEGRRYELLGELPAPDQLPEIDITPFQKEERSGPQQMRSSPIIETSDMGRVYKYLDKCDIAVSGNHGHRTFFGVCCRILRAFPWLSWEQYVSVATYYSDHRSDPSWKPSEVLHKCQDSWRKERSA
jgi:hypothetical protein